MANLPRPVTASDFYLAAILDELRQMKDRLPSPAATPEPGLTPLSEPARPQMTPLPDDFPARDKLAAAGILYLETVPRDGDALVAIKGIGTATAGQILAYLVG